MSDVVVGATCILDRSKILGWEGSRLAKMTDDEEELGTDQVLADAMRSTPPWQAEPERKEAMRSRRLTLRSVDLMTLRSVDLMTLRSVVARSEHLRYRIWLSNGLILYCFSMFVVRRRMWYFWRCGKMKRRRHVSTGRIGSVCRVVCE